MTDRELLEMAAKAAGMRYTKPTDDYKGSYGLALCDEHGRHTRSWSPLNDDGDALRLLAQLDLELFFNTMPYDMCVCVSRGNRPGLWSEPFGPDKLAATRRAIVRAAAEIGKDMK